jgi:hypothetical protein
MKTVGNILYEKYRCGVIHGGRVAIIDGDRFFRERNPYWVQLVSDYYGKFAFIEFPALFLHGLLDNCIQGYRRHLLAKGKIPADILWEATGPTDDVMRYLDLLDSDTLPEGAL